ALHISLIFSKEIGLLIFLRKSLSSEEFRDNREEILKFLTAFVEKIGQKLNPYACNVKSFCLISIRAQDRAGRYNSGLLNHACSLLLQSTKSPHCIEEFKVSEMFNKFYGELAQRSKLPDTVLEKVYELLGVLGEVQPSEMLHNSEKLFRAFLGELKTQMRSTTKEPKLSVVAGCLRGLTALMINFTKSVDEDPKTSKEIFDYAVMAISPQVDLKRYAVPLAGLRMFALHANQFNTCLMDNYRSLFETMSKCCGHANGELKRAGYAALENFLKQVAAMVAENAELHKNKLEYFMKQFYGIIRTLDSSNKELSIAIRGYGLFAAPCKAVCPEDVDLMYTELIQRCKQMYLTETDTEDDNVYQLPSFLQSIASVLFHIDRIPEVYTPVLERLLVVQIDSFAQYSQKMQPTCCKSIVKVFLALAGKGPVLWSFISTVVHQGLIRVCSKPVPLSTKNACVNDTHATGPSVNRGYCVLQDWIRQVLPYVYAVRVMPDIRKMKQSALVDETFGVVNSPLQSLNRLLYDELIKSILKIIEKLDLNVQKQKVGDQEGETDPSSTIIIPTSDPAANLQPSKPKDFTAFINLVEFCRELLPEKHVEFFEPWMYGFGHEVILQSTRLPLVSGFYKLLSVSMKIARKIKYFEGVSSKSCKQNSLDPEKYACFALFAKFGKEVCARMKQYKDELLASCLGFILSLPHTIVELDVKAYIPALQVGFVLKCSQRSKTDKEMSALGSDDVVPTSVSSNVLKNVGVYISISVNTSDTPSSWEVLRLSRASQKGDHKVLIRLLKKAKAVSLNEDSSLGAVRGRVVRVLGSLGGQVNRSLVTAASSEEMMKKFVSWDTEKRLSFAVPFADMKPVIYLDSFLPRIAELALSSSDRQTKIFLCEYNFVFIEFCLSSTTSTQQEVHRLRIQHRITKRHEFPVLKRATCTENRVTRQLYEPLVMQLIHWFTNNKKFESQDTVAMLEAIMFSACSDVLDSTLRDFCGLCIQEFLKWSIKQTTPKQQESTPANTKSLFKRLYSYALHPGAFKRLGAALAFNNLYKEFREESALVDKFVFETLVVYMESLALAHMDEKSLGTVQQCCDAIDHLKRIIEQKAPSLNKAATRRVPRGFSPDKVFCLSDVVMWLLVQCGRPQTACGHKAMELFYEFVPLLPGKKSPAAWLDEVLKKQGVSFLIQKFEGGGNTDDRLSGILSQPTLCDLQEPFSLRAVVQWMDMLLAALDCYNTFIELRMINPREIFGTTSVSGFLRAVEFFLTRLATQDITAAEQCFTAGSKDTMFSPREREDYSYSKCTIIVRILTFVSMVLEKCQPDLWKVLEKDLLTPALLELTVRTVCEPASIGFNTADVQVMKNLPEICVRLLKALMKSPYKDTLEASIRKRITARSIKELCSVDLYNPDARLDHIRLGSILSACKQLYDAGLLNSAVQYQSGDFNLQLGSTLLSVVYKGIAPGDERKSLPSIDISSKRLADGLLQLAFSFGLQSGELVCLLLNRVTLSVPLSGTSQRNFITFFHGEYFYNLFMETTNSELLRNLSTAVSQLMNSAAENPKMVGAILNGLLDQSFRNRTVRKQQGSQLVDTVLQNWTKLSSWWIRSSSPESKMAALTLLSKVLQIDSSVSFNPNHAAFPAVFNTYTTLLTDQTLALNLKSQAVIVLPFFTNLPEDHLADLKNALDQLVAFNFPMKSDEFPKGTLKYNNYVDCIKKFLDALELSQSPMLLRLMTEILCRDSKHCLEELFLRCFKKIVRRGSCDRQVTLLDTVYKMFQDEGLLSNTTRQAIMDRTFLTIMLNCSIDALKEFLCKNILDVMGTLQARFTKSNESAFDTQVTKKTGCYKLLEVMCSRLPKDDIYSEQSRINQAFHGSCSAQRNGLSKTLLKLCYDEFTENMAGETQLLEKRRQYHCAAYNCAIAVISCIFTESKFYQGFLFSEKPEKNCAFFFFLFFFKTLSASYYFSIIETVFLFCLGIFFLIDEPQYMSSQSYMADSSLSEEMSQFDFSTGVQSFSYSSQNRAAAVVHSRRKERTESVVQDDVMEFEMDELNQHECMAAMTALINHMQRNKITPQVEESSFSMKLKMWICCCHSGNHRLPLNRVGILRLVKMTVDVFRPYAKHWLGPFLQLVVSGNNGGEGIHYMVVDIVVTVLSWANIAAPKGNTRDEILANRLLEFLMKNTYHEKRAVFRHNLEIIKTVVECWKDCLAVPYSLLYQRFSGKDPNTKDNTVGIQLLGIILANNLPPHDPTCSIDMESYVKALANNLSFTRYKEVYAAAAEVLGLVLQYRAEKEKELGGPIIDSVVRELKQLQSIKEDKFIVCLSKIVKNFALLADRFMSVVFFLLPKLHGVLKTHCLEVVMSRAEEIPDIFLQLKSKDFIQLMNHRDDARQRVCLDIVYKIMFKLKPVEMKEFLVAVTGFISHPSTVCRERMYEILMWIHDNYRDQESQANNESREVLKLASEVLLQGLTDENPGLQLYVRNFWSDENRLPVGTLDRMLVILKAFYCNKIETQYLSLATNLMLEMTSRSPDYTREIFEHPLSECKFQDYIIDSNWRHRSTVLTPMFVETQASQSTARFRSQEGPEQVQGSLGGQVRATQVQFDFTPTQNTGIRSSFNWLTGSSVDTFAEYSLPSSSESLASSLLAYGKRSEKSQRAAMKPVGPDFGKRRLALPGDEVDSRTKVADQRLDILRLRRRFLKDQEKVSLIYARKGVQIQKEEQKMKAELKMKQDAQVTLYRRYRQGDLPDIQIHYSSLIAPLQALAQRDPTLAKQLFSNLFTGILTEMEKSRSDSERKTILLELLGNFNGFLSNTTVYFPPFVTCIQDMSYQHAELLNLDPASVSASCLASLQQPMGVLLLEQGLIQLLAAEEPPAKRARGRKELPPDTIRWLELAKLYRSLGDYDVLRGIFSGMIGTKQVTQKALLAEAKSDYSEAVRLYDEALNVEEWPDGEPTEAEKDFWELAALECYSHLTEWKALEYCSTVNIDDKTPADLENIWNDPFYQETYLPYLMRSKVKLLLLGQGDQSLLTFIDNAMKVEERKALLETHYSQELSLLYILQDDFDRAKYYVGNCMQVFMQLYIYIYRLLLLLLNSQKKKLNRLTCINFFFFFLVALSDHLNSRASLRRLLRNWSDRYPDAKMDPVNIWDDIITNRCFFLDKIQEHLCKVPADESMEVDGEGDASPRMDVDEEPNISAMVQSCKFNMKLKMAESARKQNNFSVATKLLKELHRESKSREECLTRWVHSYSRFGHSRSQSQSCPERIQTVMKTISLLDVTEESKADYLNKNTRALRDQNILLGTTYNIIANALNKTPTSLQDIGEEKARKIQDLSGAQSDHPEQIVISLYRKALSYLQTAAKKAEEQVQSRSTEHIDVAGVIEAYMTLVDFCDKRLREVEESAEVSHFSELQTFPAVVVENLLRALKLNSREARLKFPRLLQIVELYPAETLDLMAKMGGSVPCWQFIGWISQMMALLDKKEAVAVQHIVEKIAESYPQAIVYNFMISSESYSFEESPKGKKNKEFVARLKSELDKGAVVEDFIHALEQLTNSDMIFKDWVDDVRNELDKPQRNKANLKRMYEEMYANLGNLRAPGLGSFRSNFVKAYGKEFERVYGKRGEKLLDMKSSDFFKVSDQLLTSMRKFQREPGNLKEYSPWMSQFKPEFLRNELEIPGQYDGKSKPMPEYHAKITGFDERIKVMASIRKPKRLIIQGNDEREHPFLVKGGEDLRQDQRIEQLFEVMNIILSQDAACSQRNLQLKTYQVIPMTTRIGLIEWLENTCTLKEFLSNAMTEEERTNYETLSPKKGPKAQYNEWLTKMAGGSVGPQRYGSMYKRASRTETVMAFRSVESLVSRDLLRRAFTKMSTSPEAFLTLRSHFASSHALMCISHWILGIGDRHLSNFMINMETGGMVGIDFGHAFGSATQFLPVPELMPFRLTSQFLNLMLPMKEQGLLYSVMVHALRAYRANPDLLLNTMDVFVKEPSLDWKNFELKQLKKGGSWTKEVNTKEVNWYPVQKVKCGRQKLEGVNPIVITCNELQLGHEKLSAYQSYLAVVKGDPDHNVRAREVKEDLPVETQVACLIDQATDPNILGRVWEGWEPWM
uniref:DNA-dependent protein kinase catalytic subunit n=1 Tax=Latimeria chalumnae TaxID=7897 RepID=H3B272_LATCH